MRTYVPCLLIFLASCNEPEALPEMTREVSPPPAQLCEQARQGLSEVRNQGGLVTTAGENVMEQQTWLQIGPQQQEQLVQALAVEQACASDEGTAEQEVVIRNEGGMVIVRRTVSLTADAGSFLDE